MCDVTKLTCDAITPFLCRRECVGTTMGVTATMDTTAATATMVATVTMAGGDAVAMVMAAIDTTAANQQQQRQ